MASDEEVRAYCASDTREIPDGHRHGWDHSAVPLGWVANLVGGGGSAVDGGWEGDVPVNDNDVENDYGVEDEVMDAVTTSAVNAVVHTPRSDAPVGSGAGAVAVASGDIDDVCRFLRGFGGVPNVIVDGGSWAGLVGYVQGRFA